jgi:hypothetical protein
MFHINNMDNNKDIHDYYDPEIETKKNLLWNNMVHDGFIDLDVDQMTKEFALRLGLHDFDYVEKHHDSFTDHKIKHDMFLLSVRYSTINIINFLINKFKIDITYKNRYGYNCVLIACGYVTDLETIKFLIDQMTDNMKFPQRLEERNNNGDTILTHACWTNPNLEIIKYLIDEIQMDLMAKDYHSCDCLVIACWKNPNLDVIKYLVEEKGFNVKQQCLTRALSKNTNFSVIEYLIGECDVSTNIPYHYLANRSMREIAYVIQHSDQKNIKMSDLCDILNDYAETFKDFRLVIDILNILIPCDRIIAKKSDSLNHSHSDQGHQITDGQITDSQVTDSQITDSQVTDGQITDSRVTDGQITDSRVTDGQITDYTTPLPDLLFTCNSNKYYGYRDIVFDSIIFFKEIKDVVDFDQEIVIPGSFSKHVMNLYLHMVHSDGFKIQLIKPCDIIEFLRLIDMYPTQHLSIGHIESELCCYFEEYCSELFFDDFIQNMCVRYGFRKMYTHIHNVKISKNQNKDQNKNQNM